MVGLGRSHTCIDHRSGIDGMVVVVNQCKCNNKRSGKGEYDMTAQRILHTSHRVAGVLVVYAVVVALVVQKNGEGKSFTSRGWHS